jgi:hypothetical protein
MITALSGTSRLRNTTISSRNDSTSTMPMNQGSRSAVNSAKSTTAAVDPPTR